MRPSQRYLYVVRCNFTGGPELEAEWNAWYGGPKFEAMLRFPQFLGCQRFRACALDVAVRYVAIWRVESPQAFETTEYTHGWGWGRWRPYIDDWTRNLYRVLGDEDLPAADDDSRLILRAYEGELPADQLEGTRTWMTSVGLDCSWPALSAELCAFEELESVSDTDSGAAEGTAWATAFEPIAPFQGTC